MSSGQRKIKKQSRQSRTMGDRWHDATLLYKLVVGIGTTIIVFGGTYTAWGNLGARRVVPAIIGYVDDAIDTKTIPIITAQTKFEAYIQSSNANQVQSQLDNAVAEAAKWAAELTKANSQQTRSLIQARIDTLQKQIPQLQDDIRTLKNIHGK